MNLSPLIARELRVQSRNPANHRLRVAVVVVSAIVSAVVMTSPGSAQHLGAALFGDLNTILLVTMAIFLPGMTADCLSRERREGTLSLLFLTPLGAGEIVVAKALVYLFRALSMLLTLLPIFSVPYLLGGVGWRETALAIVTDTTLACLFLSAGLLASSLCLRWSRAILVAQLISFGLAAIYGLAYATLLFKGRSLFGRWGDPFRDLLSWLYLAMLFLSDAGGCWSEFYQFLARIMGSSLTWPHWFASLGYSTLLAVAMILTAFLVALGRVRRARYDTAVYSETPWIRRLSTPVIWREYFRKHLDRTLDRNPIAWLQIHSCGGRSAKWSWCLAIVLIQCVTLQLLVTGSSDTFWLFQFAILFILGLIIVFVATASFVREKENGVLELLLVSPLSVNQIIVGRVIGIWTQFAPSILVISLFLSILWSWAPVPGTDGSFAGFATLLVSGAVAASVVGMYFSLRARKLGTAMMLTLGFAVVLPMCFAPAANSFAMECFVPDSIKWPDSDGSFARFAIAVAVFQGLFSLLSCFLLRHSLSRRIFPF